MKAKNLAALAGIVAVSALVLQSCGAGSGTDQDFPEPVIIDINGGVAGSGTVGSIFVIDGTGFGAPTGTSAGYLVNFREATTNTVVANAVVDLGTAGNWTDVFIKASVPAGLTVGTTYKVTVSTPGGTSNALNFLVLANVSFSPSTILWSPAPDLPVALQGFPTVTGILDTSVHIYAVGGNTATAGTVDGTKLNVDTVYHNLIDETDGTLTNASWEALTPLPAKRGFAAAVFAHRYNSLVNGGAIYVLGGLDADGAATSTVYFALPSAADGTIPGSGTAGTWATTTALPQPLFATTAVIFHGRIYVAGGNGSTGSPVAKVYAAAINADGSIGSWTALADLPVALAYHQLAMIAGSLYVLGGDSAAEDPLSNAQSASVQDEVYYNRIDLQTGSLAAAWTVNPNTLTKAREKFSAVAAGGYILVSGGLYSGNPGSSEQSYAAINTDGSLASFNGATGVHTISNSSGTDLFNHSCAFIVDASGYPHVLILGGADVTSGALLPQVWYQH